MSGDWKGLLRIDHIEQVRNGRVIWEADDLPNVLHFLGEQWAVKALFTGGKTSNTFIPDNYYVGLDARSAIATTDTMSSIVNEPVGNGYLRQAISSTTGFTIEVKSGFHRAVGRIVTFTATGAGWGPVSNIFLTDTLTSTGTLISTVALTNPITTIGGDAINMRIAVSLRWCP